jgi:hypothetical protein
MAVFIFGRRLTGKVERHEKSYVATMMGHFNFLPLVPHEGFVVYRHANGNDESFRIPRDRRSLVAAYVRGWSFVVLMAPFVLVGVIPHALWPLSLVVAFAAFVAILVWSFLGGRLTPIEREQRRFHALVTGLPVDPRHLVHAGPMLPATVHETLTILGKKTDVGTYRTRHDPANDWAGIALEPTMQTAAYLVGALTLARLELGLADGERRVHLDATHDAIWRKLQTLAKVPADVDWTPWKNASTEPPLGETDAQAEARLAAAAIPPPQPWVYQAPTARGRSFEQGWDVEVDRRAYVPPSACASCRRPAERMVARRKRGVKLDVPYCTLCGQQATAGWNNTRGRQLQFIVLFGASIFGAVGLVPGLPLVVACALAVGVAVAGTVGFLVLVPVQKFPAPASATIDGARLVKVAGDRATLFCTNEAWAADLAAAHGSVPARKTRPNHSVFVIPRYAVFAAPVVAVFAWLGANPEVHVDNGFHEPLQLWVDGRPSIVVPASTKKDGAEPATVRVSYGQHVLGWSRLGATAPEHTTRARIEFDGNHLYVPGALLCHFNEVMLYGDQVSLPVAAGPVPIAEFQTFKRVDAWFHDLPAQIETKSGGEARVAVKRWEACEYITSPPCPAGERARYWDCVRKIWESDDPKQVERCEQITAAACGIDAPP